MKSVFDDAIVGAGVIGLAHAYALARRGRRVVVVERSPLPMGAVGASIRNFGMLWPIGQPAGEMYELARRSREIWLEILRTSGLWHEESGSLHLAYQDDEAIVLSEFVGAAPGAGFDCEWLNPRQVQEKSSFIKLMGLRGALWSPTEICVDPRYVIRFLPTWLNQEYGVTFYFNCVAGNYTEGRLLAGGVEIMANNLYVCAGDDMQTLFPTAYAESGLFRCKLQMMRSTPLFDQPRIGPMLAAGLTLIHYRSFQDCPSLPHLKRRLELEMAEHLRYGVHVLASQNGLGELTIGDSHEYGVEIDPFDKPQIDKLVLSYLNEFLDLPDLEIGSRWNGVYLKHPNDPYFIARPAKGATVITGVGGAGMTLSFGLAENVVRENLGEKQDAV